MHMAAPTWGYPRSFLTDNGAVFTASAVKGTSAMEAELLTLGIASKHGKPYHPQTLNRPGFHRDSVVWEPAMGMSTQSGPTVII